MYRSISCVGRCSVNRDNVTRIIYDCDTTTDNATRNDVMNRIRSLPRELQDMIFRRIPYRYLLCDTPAWDTYKRKQSYCKRYHGRYCLPGTTYINTNENLGISIVIEKWFGKQGVSGRYEEGAFNIKMNLESTKSSLVEEEGEEKERSYIVGKHDSNNNTLHTNNNSCNSSDIIKKHFYYPAFPFNQKDNVIIYERPFDGECSPMSDELREKMFQRYLLLNDFKLSMICTLLSITRCIQYVKPTCIAKAEFELKSLPADTDIIDLLTLDHKTVFHTATLPALVKSLDIYPVNSGNVKTILKLSDPNYTTSVNYTDINPGHYYWEIFNDFFEKKFHGKTKIPNPKKSAEDSKSDWYNVTVTMRKIRPPVGDETVKFITTDYVKLNKCTSNIHTENTTFKSRYIIKLSLDVPFNYDDDDGNNNVKQYRLDVPVYKHSVLPENSLISIKAICLATTTDADIDENNHHLVEQKVNDVLPKSVIGFEIIFTDAYIPYAIQRSSDGDIRFILKTRLVNIDDQQSRNTLFYTYFTEKIAPRVHAGWFAFDHYSRISFFLPEQHIKTMLDYVIEKENKER